MSATSIDIPNAPYWQAASTRMGETVTGVLDIAQSIGTIFRTQPGTVPLMPRFGFDALSALDKPLREGARKLERMALEAFYWEPRAEALSVKASFIDDTTALLLLIWRPVGAAEAIAQVVSV